MSVLLYDISLAHLFKLKILATDFVLLGFLIWLQLWGKLSDGFCLTSHGRGFVLVILLCCSQIFLKWVCSPL